jgi:membrane associated rhomboid family serine protease
MPPPDEVLTTEETLPPENLVEAGVYATAREGFDHGLVVLAAGFSYWLFEDTLGFRLLVEAPHLAEVQRQLTAFDRESLRWPPPAPAKRETPPFALQPLAFLWALLVLGGFQLQANYASEAERFGPLDSQRIFQNGEGWRLVTSLFLHADIGHLTSNLVSGVFVFSAVISFLGKLRGAALLFFATLLGQLAISGIHCFGVYRSIGASTAVFAGLGLLTGDAARGAFQDKGKKRWVLVVLPIAAGGTLLGLFGAGGAPNVDVGAHASGFLAGLFLGWATRRAKNASPG